jgi:SAM-dependent methyltransferase
MSGFDSRYTPHLLAAEDRHFWFRARNSVIGAVAQRLLPSLPADYRVLEVGCGNGNTLRVLDALCRRGSLIGIDSHREGLALAGRRVRCPLVQADIRMPPFADAVRFDLVCMFDVLEHIDDDVGALADIRTRMTEKGVLLLTVPAGPELWSAFDVAARHCRRYTPVSLTSALTAGGFRVEYLSPFMTVLYPLAWIKRRWPARAAGGRDPVLDDLRIVPVVNGLLAWLLARDASLVAARRRLPFGTSLIAIAGRA